MKIYIELTYNKVPVDAYQFDVQNADPKSRQITIELAPLLRERIEHVIQKAKRSLARELAKSTAATHKPAKPKSAKKKDPKK